MTSSEHMDLQPMGHPASKRDDLHCEIFKTFKGIVHARTLTEQSEKTHLRAILHPPLD